MMVTVEQAPTQPSGMCVYPQEFMRWFGCAVNFKESKSVVSHWVHVTLQIPKSDNS